MIKIILSFLIGGCIFLFINKYVSDKTDNSKIKELQLINDSLAKENIKLDSVKTIYLQDLNTAAYKVAFLESNDNKLQNQISNINQSIKNIQNKYETANHFSDSYSSDDISRYFSNLR